MATIETTLTTRDAQIRQLAFDGDDASFLESKEPPGADDHFTLVLDRPVRLPVDRRGHRPGRRRRRGPGRPLEVSADGTTFRQIARFIGGTARGGPAAGAVRAIRIKPGPADGPIAIRELTIDSNILVPFFTRSSLSSIPPTRPDLKPWAEDTAQACERAYAMINDELAATATAATEIWLALSASYRGVAKMSGDDIVGSADHFRGHRKDVGQRPRDGACCARLSARERPVAGRRDCDDIRFFHGSRATWGGSNRRRPTATRAMA